MQKIFDVKSPGFLYSLLVFAFTLFAASGINLGADPAHLAEGITTTLSNYGVWAMVGVVASSVIFPVWNAFRSGATDLKSVLNALKSSWLTWIALVNAILALLAVTGFSLPDGTVEKVFAYIQAKDWSALINIAIMSILPTIVRFFKSNRR